MRALFTVSSWPTHWATMVPLGWALQAAGHEVRVLCAASQVQPLTATGLVPVPVLDGMTVVVRNRLQAWFEAAGGLSPYPWLPLHPITGEQLGALDDFDVAEYRDVLEPAYAAEAARSFDAAVEFARAWRPDVVVHDPASLEGLLAGRVLGVPTALCLWGPPGTEEPEHVRVVPHDISGSFERYGLGPMDTAMIERVVDPCPAALAPPTGAERLPVRFVPYNGSAPMPTWLLEPPDRPRVCVSWSTALSTMCGPNSYLLPELIRALDGQGLEVVLTATEKDVAALGSVPDSVRVLQRMPLRLLLPTCSAVVHHGGAGSTMTALWAGVPQLVATFAAEQACNGGRVDAAGGGRHLPGHLADRDTVRDAVRELVEKPVYAERAAQLREEIHSRPSPAALVRTLERLAA